MFERRSNLEELTTSDLDVTAGGDKGLTDGRGTPVQWADDVEKKLGR